VIAHSPLLEEALRFSTTMSSVVDIYHGDALVYPAVKVVAGSVTCDRSSKVRWSASVDLALYPWELLPLLDSYRTRFKVYRGLTSLGRTEMMQLGEYRVDEIDRSNQGKVALKGSGLESYVVDARFVVPRTPPYGVSITQAISDLITEAVPAGPPVLAQNTTNARVRATSPWDTERWDAVLDLGDTINADVYADNTGTFVIRDKPSLIGRVPVFTINAGAAGVLLTESVKQTRDGVYNAVSVNGNPSNLPPVWAWARDTDPASATYFYGDFGQKPKFFASQFMYTTAQCQLVADNQLAAELVANQAMSFTSTALCFLEAGDVVQLVLSDGSTRQVLLQKTATGLGHDGTMAADAVSNL
jgi:hypothetical protein